VSHVRWSTQLVHCGCVISHPCLISIKRGEKECSVVAITQDVHTKLDGKVWESKNTKCSLGFLTVRIQLDSEFSQTLTKHNYVRT
jgi:hypothetical protein